jgi:hypothetical protein
MRQREKVLTMFAWPRLGESTSPPKKPQKGLSERLLSPLHGIGYSETNYRCICTQDASYIGLHWFDHRWGQKFFPSTARLDRPWGSPSLLPRRYRGQNGQKLRLTTHLHLSKLTSKKQDERRPRMPRCHTACLILVLFLAYTSTRKMEANVPLKRPLTFSGLRVYRIISQKLELFIIYLFTHRTTQTHNNRTQTSMPLVGFEHTIPVFERAKTVHALDRAATVIGHSS